MQDSSVILADASGLRNFVRFAQINGIQLSAFLSSELMQLVDSCENLDRIPALALVDIMELSAIVGRRPSIGVEVASWADIHAIGLLSILLDACPTIAEALRIQSEYVHLESFAIDAFVEEQGDEMKVRHTMNVTGQFGQSQYAEGSMLVAIRMIRMTAGESWSPLRVEFEHPAPDNLRVHLAQFRCPITFGAEQTALYIDRAQMARPLPRGNPRVLAYLEKHLETLAFALNGTIEAEVTRLIAQKLSAGNARLAVVAKEMGMQPRALQRRLASEKLEFSALLNKARKQVVEQFIRSERQPELMRLAYRLGYSEASNASRFVRQLFGKSLRELIREERANRIRP